MGRMEYRVILRRRRTRGRVPTSRAVIQYRIIINGILVTTIDGSLSGILRSWFVTSAMRTVIIITILLCIVHRRSSLLLWFLSIRMRRWKRNFPSYLQNQDLAQKEKERRPSGKLFTSTTGSDMKKGKNTKRLEKNGVWSLVEAGYMEYNNKHRILNNHAK